MHHKPNMSQEQAQMVLRLMRLSIPAVPLVLCAALTFTRQEPPFPYYNLVIPLVVFCAELTGYIVVKKIFIKQGLLPKRPREVQSRKG